MRESIEDLKEWKEVSQKPNENYISWENELIGKPIIGKLISFETGSQGGQIATLKNDKGIEIRFSACTVLYDKLKGSEGEEVKIVYEGLKMGKNKRAFKDFKVFTLANAGIEEQGAGAKAPSPENDRTEAFL